MARPTAEIERLLRARQRGTLNGVKAIQGILGEVRLQILEELRTVDGESYSALALRRNLASIERHLADFEGRAGREVTGLIEQAWTAGAELVPRAAQSAGLGVGAFGHIASPLLETMQDFSFHKIRGISQAAFDRIRAELTLGLLGQKTPHQVTMAVAGTLESPGVFASIATRAEVIVKTEMGRAYAAATVEGLKQAGENGVEMHKQWWHAGHPARPRMSHLALHGQIQPVDKPFMVGTVLMDYPRDPKAPASEVINCGCEVLPWHPAWGDPHDERNRLPIFNERGEEIARRGPRTGREESLAGKFALGRRERKGGA